MSRLPAAPAGLGLAARRLWNGLLKECELRPDEMRVLEDACREVDLIDRLEEAARNAPLTVPGSRGQTTSNPLLPELRQHRALLARLLSQLDIPDEVEPASASTKGRKAALARWHS